MLTPSDAHNLMLDTIHAAMKEGPIDTDRFYYRMGANVLDSFRTSVGVRLTSSGSWYLWGHRIDVDYVNPDTPVTIEVTQ